MQLSATNILIKHIRLLLLLWVVLTPALLSASKQEQMSKSVDEFGSQKGQKEYSFDAGLQLGAGYYIGDANSIPFVQPRYVLGAQFRYKMSNQRLALQCKVQRTCVAYNYTAQEETEQALQPTIYQNPMWNADLVCEFNFFKFGAPSYDYRVKTFTPYIFLGVGGSLSNKAAMLMTEELIPMILSRFGEGGACGRECQELLAVRLAAYWRQVWCTHLPLYRRPESLGRCGARGYHEQD